VPLFQDDYWGKGGESAECPDCDYGDDYTDDTNETTSVEIPSMSTQVPITTYTNNAIPSPKASKKFESEKST
jgi:hypothetical protein